LIYTATNDRRPPDRPLPVSLSLSLPTADFRPRISADGVSRDLAPRETRMDVRAKNCVIGWGMGRRCVAKNNARIN